MASQRRVALLIESSRSYGRGVLQGIGKYAHSHTNWALRHHEMTYDAAPPNWLRKWKGDGVIARIETEQMARALRRLKLPTVDVRCRRKWGSVPQVETDDRQVVELAVNHLRERGLRQFAFCGFQGANYSVRRLKFFREILSQQDETPFVYESPGPESPTTTGAELLGMLDEDGVTKWLKSLPQPVGLLASNDIRAQHVLIACRNADLRVPDEVAVIGVDNDDVICPLCDPPLSSVEPDTEQVGYVAASVLESMMQGGPAPSEPIFVPPRGVVARRSTELWAMEDEAIARACQFARDSISDGINVNDVVRAAGISRRALERRMAKILNKTPHELIASLRLQRLRQLLDDTNLPLQQVAALAGFDYVENMHLFFRRHTGTSPGRYRDVKH